MFEGLLTLQRTGSWRQALEVAVPARKGFRLLDHAEIEQRWQTLTSPGPAAAEAQPSPTPAPAPELVEPAP